jgi:3-hydroxyisobutyrate dehydrogenase-like beta-hydroxyacid dehydrogenase
MAANLLLAGYRLRLFNRNPNRCSVVRELAQELAAERSAAAEAGSRTIAGSAATASPAEAVAGCPVVCLCLSDDQAVRAVLLEQPDAALAALEPGSLVIDFSTIAPATSQALAVQLAQRGVTYIDAPVTGGTEGARAGRLAVLAGGEEAALQRARPLLEVVGGSLSHLGPVGAGQQAKAVNQVLVAGSYAAVAEAVALGRRLGLPMESLLSALGGGAAGSWALQHRSGAMLRGQFPLGFRLSLHRKDLAIALDTAAACDLELPVSAQVAALEDALIARGHGDEDVSALVRWFEGSSGD